MVAAHCPRSDCNGTGFELKEVEIRNSRFRHYGVICTKCGALVSVLDFDNVGGLLRTLASKLGVKL